MYNKLFSGHLILSWIIFLFLGLLTSCGDNDQDRRDQIERHIKADPSEGFLQAAHVKGRDQMLKDEAASVNDWDSFAKVRYGKFGKGLYDRFYAFSPAFLPLLVDAGIAMRADQFLNFAAALDTSKPWEAREAFSKKLGTKTYYRGLMLSDAEFNTIKANGIQSSSLRSHIAPKNSFGASLITDIMDRLDEKNMSINPLLSITETFDIARSVPCSTESTQGKKVHVFALKLPVLDSVSTGLKKDWFEEAFLNYLHTYGLPTRFLPQMYLPAALESFLPFQINVAEITGIDVMAHRSTEECRNVLQSSRESFGITI